MRLAGRTDHVRTLVPVATELDQRQLTEQQLAQAKEQGIEVLTEIGPVEIEGAPGTPTAAFDPRIVKKRQRRLTGIDEIVLSLTTKGLTTGEVAAHFADEYGGRCRRGTPPFDVRDTWRPVSLLEYRVMSRCVVAQTDSCVNIG